MITGATGLRNAQTQFSTANTKPAPDRLTSSAQQFESMLLGQWLADAESSFGSAPGGGDDDQDADGDQMKDFGVRALANQLTASGGIGISRILREALVQSEAHGNDLSKPARQTVVDAQSAASAALAYGREVTR